jgi:hypothetical protein
VIRRAGLFVSLSATLAWSSMPLLVAAEDTAGDVAVTTDLTSVIALQGLPCGQVVSAARQGENDYIATCSDGNRYRVTVNAEGRVVVQKQ